MQIQIKKSVKESEDAKLFEDITGKALGEANLIQIVKDLILENKKKPKEILGNMNFADLSDKDQNEEISKCESYTCEKCDFEFDEEDA